MPDPKVQKAADQIYVSASPIFSTDFHVVLRPDWLNKEGITQLKTRAGPILLYAGRVRRLTSWHCTQLFSAHLSF